MLEQAQVLGGCSTTESLLPDRPGFRFNRGAIDLAHIQGTGILDELELARHGLKLIYHEPMWYFPSPDGTSVSFFRDIDRTYDSIAANSAARMFKVDVALRAKPTISHPGGDQGLTSNINIAPSLEHVQRAFHQYAQGKWTPDPPLMAAVPSILDTTLAPEGQHTLWLSQFNPGAYWKSADEREREACADSMIETFCRYAQAPRASYSTATSQRPPIGSGSPGTSTATRSTST